MFYRHYIALFILSILGVIAILLTIHSATQLRKSFLASQAKAKALSIQLAQTQQMLNQSHSDCATSQKQLEHFKRLFSHDLRVPVSVIQGYADLLYHDMIEDKDVQKVYLEKIVLRTQYINDSLSHHLATLSYHTHQFLPKPMVLLPLIKQVTDDMSNVSTSRGILIQFLPCSHDIVVLADTHQLNKILFNLIENSLKYMLREGIITISISTDNNFATVVVKDDGMGLDKAETTHIFERHFQGSTHMGNTGSGYGLYLVRQYVETMGGTIWAKSDLGLGMSIAFTLPLSIKT